MEKDELADQQKECVDDLSQPVDQAKQIVKMLKLNSIDGVFDNLKSNIPKVITVSSAKSLSETP